jgi:F0F1-type ATP synthase assembly protein I
MKDLTLVLSGIVIGLLISLWFVPSYLYMHPLVMVLVIVVGLAGAFALGVVAGRRTVKPPAVSLRGRVYEEPAALALVEIALKRQGGVG